MNVLIDRNGLQARRHLQDKKRLATLINELEACSYSVEFSQGPELSPSELDNCDVLIITTRYPMKYSYTRQEMQYIDIYIHRGGGIFLMSNHSDCVGNPYDTREFDNQLARKILGFTFEPTFYTHTEKGNYTELSGSDLNQEHPIISGRPKEDPISSVITNTCCSIASDKGCSIVSISSKTVDLRNGSTPKNRCFCLAIDTSEHETGSSKGRIVAIADSGFIGAHNTNKPGPGLIEQGDNKRFIVNITRWLFGELSS